MKPILTFVVILSYLFASGQDFFSQKEMMRKMLQKAKEETAFKTPEYWQNVNAQLYDYGRTGLATIQTFDNRYAGVMGTPYLYSKWMKGAVMLSGYDQPQVAFLNYDCVNDQLIFRNKDGVASSFPNGLVKSFAVQDSVLTDSLHYFISIGPGEKKPSYYQVLYSGKTLLLERHKKVLRKANYQTAYSSDRRYDEFIDMNELRIMSGNGDLQKIKLNKKAISELYPDRADKLDLFIRQNNMDLKSNADLVRVLSYMDSL